MAANRYLLRLYQLGDLLREQETNLDPNDDARLRELLEEQVKAVKGTLRLDLSQGYRLSVQAPGGGRIYARVSVDKSGRTVVKR